MFNLPSVFLRLCASVLNVRPIASLCSIPRDSVSLFESHVPLRLCDRRTILSILIILAILLLFLSADKNPRVILLFPDATFCLEKQKVLFYLPVSLVLHAEL
jgi:hypothetical protein